MVRDFDYSLHDADIEAVVVGPRREIRLSLALGSARISDPRLPKEAELRFGDIKNFEHVRGFFTSFEPEPVARIDSMTLQPRAGSWSTVGLEIDPQGIIEVVCRHIDLIPVVVP